MFAYSKYLLADYHKLRFFVCYIVCVLDFLPVLLSFIPAHSCVATPHTPKTLLDFFHAWETHGARKSRPVVAMRFFLLYYWSIVVALAAFGSTYRYIFTFCSYNSSIHQPPPPLSLFCQPLPYCCALPYFAAATTLCPPRYSEPMPARVHACSNWSQCLHLRQPFVSYSIYIPEYDSKERNMHLVALRFCATQP